MFVRPRSIATILGSGLAFIAASPYGQSPRADLREIALSDIVSPHILLHLCRFSTAPEIRAPGRIAPLLMVILRRAILSGRKRVDA